MWWLSCHQENIIASYNQQSHLQHHCHKTDQNYCSVFEYCLTHHFNKTFNNQKKSVLLGIWNGSEVLFWVRLGHKISSKKNISCQFSRHSAASLYSLVSTYFPLPTFCLGSWNLLVGEIIACHLKFTFKWLKATKLTVLSCNFRISSVFLKVWFRNKWGQGNQCEKFLQVIFSLISCIRGRIFMIIQFFRQTCYFVKSIQNCIKSINFWTPLCLGLSLLIVFLVVLLNKFHHMVEQLNFEHFQKKKFIMSGSYVVQLITPKFSD